MSKPTFYMVYLEGGGDPTHRHATLDGAIEESKRLVKLTKKKAYVLCPIKSIELNEFKIEDFKLDENDDLPF